MKFGTLNELQPGAYDQGPEEFREREYQVYWEGAEQAILSEELGFDYCWAVEHHFLTEYSASSSPECWLSWVAGQTSRIRLGHGVVQLSKPMNHVLRVAERAAALDIMSNGRLDFGSGRGFTHDEIASFGVSPDDTRPMQLTAMEMLPQIWADEEFSFENEHYSIPKRRLSPRPVQRPHPPLWMATSQPTTWKIAGEMGVGVLAFGFAQPGLLQEAMRSYREAIATAKPYGGVTNEQIGFSPPMFCAPTDEEAIATAAPHLMFYLQTIYGLVNQWQNIDSKDYAWYREVSTDLLKLPELTPDESKGLTEAEQVVKAGVKGRLFCVGSPETCREFVEYYDEQGVDQMIFQVQFGRLPNEEIKTSMKTFAADVMPALSSASSAEA